MIDTTPNFYIVVPDLYINAITLHIYKVIDIQTKEVVKQIPSEQDIARIEYLAKVRNKLFNGW